MDISILTGPLITGVVMSGVLTILFSYQERYKARKERVRYARLIDTELSRIYNILKPPSWARQATYTNHLIGPLPRNTYDGLVMSAAISVLDSDLQFQLHTFYEGVAMKRYDYLQNSIKQLRDDVHKFEMWNKQRRTFLLWWYKAT